MAWDKDLPADSTKIRNAPTVIQANWAAIEQNTDDSLNQWIVELKDRTTTAAPNTPTNVTDVGLLYARRPTGGDVNLFYQDDTGNEVQITTSGAMGNVGTDMEMEKFTFDRTIYFNENSVVSAWGLYSGGSLVANKNITSVSTTATTGLYNIVMPANVVNNANYVVVAVAIGSNFGRSIMLDSVSTPTTTTFSLRRNNSGSGGENGDFCFAVIGGQA